MPSFPLKVWASSVAARYNWLGWSFCDSIWRSHFRAMPKIVITPKDLRRSSHVRRTFPSHAFRHPRNGTYRDKWINKLGGRWQWESSILAVHGMFMTLILQASPEYLMDAQKMRAWGWVASCVWMYPWRICTSYNNFTIHPRRLGWAGWSSARKRKGFRHLKKENTSN